MIKQPYSMQQKKCQFAARSRQDESQQVGSQNV